MKKVLQAAAVLLVLGGTAARLVTRWREEAADRRVTILVDWAEVRDWVARQSLTDEELLERLRDSGVNGLMIGAATVQDYLWQDLTFNSRALAETVHRQLLDRGVTGVTLRRESGKFRLGAASKNWDRLKDVEVGFNPEFLGKARQAGFHLVLRVNQDPWLAKNKLFEDLAEISSANQELGFLLNTDEVPGGPEALPNWVSFLSGQNNPQLLFEFHPSKASLKLGYRAPQVTFRAHTIPAAELKDLTAAGQKSRWRRALQERSCRFLLFHVSPSDSLASFLENIYSLRQDFQKEGWEFAWPKPRLIWSFPSFLERQMGPVVALLLAILVPLGALRYGLGDHPWMSFVQITLLTLVGACVVAAAADNPLTRIEVVPFRGIKLAFAAAWAGSFLLLYPWKEIEAQLFENVRRIDLLVGLALVAGIGYFLVRTGNAGSGWKAGWEQGLRDRMEDLFMARPRFKEFAIGYPLLIWGLHAERKRLGRLLIGLGMIGPISMVNTFCHLHSPLSLGLWRSANGLLLGSLAGLGLVGIKKCLS